MKIRIFTDGACSENPGPGGWAVVINTTRKCYTFSGNEQLTTNNRMELRAVIEAFKKIYSKESKLFMSDYAYEICSDSAYVVNTINNHWIESWKKNGWQTTKNKEIKNRDLWEEFCKLKEKLTELGVCVTMTKIKGHSGNTFNELVDKLAKEEIIKARASK